MKQLLKRLPGMLLRAVALLRPIIRNTTQTTIDKVADFVKGQATKSLRAPR